MIEHKMDIDPSFNELQDQLNGMQKIQITQEIVENEKKEQKIEENQPKTAEEIMQEAFKGNKQGLEHAQGLYNHYVKTRIEEGDEKYQPKDLAQKAIKEANEILKHEEKEFNKWMRNAPAVYLTKEEEYSKEQWLEEFRENKKSKPEQNYLISNSQDGETAQKAIEAYEITINALNRRYISPDNIEKHELSVELVDKNTIEKIDKKTQKFLDDNDSDITISYDEAFREAVLDEVKSYKKILNNGLEKERQQDIKTANEEYQSIMKETNEEYKTYDFETWAKTSSAREFQELIDKDNSKNKQTLKEIYNDLNRQNPAQITFDIEFDNNKKDREKAEIIFQKETKGKSIGGIKEIKLANTISQNIKKEKDKEIELNTPKEELNPKEKQELAENTIKNINENERFKEYYELEDELKTNQKAQEEKIKEFQKEMDELDKEYGQGQYYKPNWTFGNDANQNSQEKPKEEQENPYKLSPEEEDKRKEYLEKRKELELKQEKEMQKLKNEEDNIKDKMNDTTIAITTCGDFEELIKNLKQLDAALIALNKNKEEQIKEEQRQREEQINLALNDDPLMQKIVGGMLKEQKEKKEELEKEQKEMDLAKEQANYLSKKVDDMQQTNNPNAKKSFAEDIEKALKTIDETKEIDKKKEKTPAEEQKIKEIKKLEEHYGKTIERARKELKNYKKQQTKQQEQTQTKTQGVTR